MGLKNIRDILAREISPRRLFILGRRLQNKFKVYGKNFSFNLGKPKPAIEEMLRNFLRNCALDIGSMLDSVV